MAEGRPPDATPYNLHIAINGKYGSFKLLLNTMAQSRPRFRFHLPNVALHYFLAGQTRPQPCLRHIAGSVASILHEIKQGHDGK